MSSFQEKSTFQWQCHPKAEKILVDYLEKCCSANPFIAKLQEDLLEQTSTRLFDWIDHLAISYDPEREKALLETGFVSRLAMPNYRIFFHPGAQLPQVIVYDTGPEILGTAIAVDSIADFLMVRGMAGWIEGSPYSLYRRCCISTENGVSLWVVERRGGRAIEPVYTEPAAIEKYLEATELWQTRPRQLENEEEGLSHTIKIATQLINLVGQDLAAWIVLEVERKYWQQRNTAGQLQKNRQDRLGMGWANHDHHTFRSSRKNFAQLVRLFEILGFYCRERFYAGQEAGWGAQVMEHQNTRLVLFLDVDLEPGELNIDFNHQELSNLQQHHTVGLWCALHGDSILKAGMHHLEAQFMFDELKQDLENAGVGMMKPFSFFPFLKQAFTKGEIWKVDPKRITKLLSENKITKEQAEKFMSEGAIGSHMENLQRREGYKGFNQQNVSEIIKKTDPRSIAF